MNMSWLEKQQFIEKDLILMTGKLSGELLDDLMPQLRLSALENSGVVSVDINLDFDLANENQLVKGEGRVHFPAKKALASAELRERKK